MKKNILIEKKEIIEKPIYHGAPLSWVDKYFKNSFESFRKKHPQFDKFLIETKEILIKKGKNKYQNLIKFTSGDVKPNYISPSEFMFKLFIKLYNYHFSSIEAYRYIDKCYKSYKDMCNKKYKLNYILETFNKRSRYDGKDKDFIVVSVIPIKEVDNNRLSFNITTSTFVELDDVLQNPDVNIEVCSENKNLLNDALCLFEYYQDNNLYSLQNI